METPRIEIGRGVGAALQEEQMRSSAGDVPPLEGQSGLR